MILDLPTMELWRVPVVRGSHHFFGSFLLSCDRAGTFEIRWRQPVKQLPWQKGADGHCSLSPDERFILTDTYPINGLKTVYLEERDGTQQWQLARVGLTERGPAPARCDLHPRWDRQGKYIIFDSTHEGKRHVYRAQTILEEHGHKTPLTETAVPADAPRNFRIGPALPPRPTASSSGAPRNFYIDLGAYNGDTVTWFAKKYTSIARKTKIYAWEANPQNYKMMEKYIASHRDLDITLVEKASWCKDGTVEFALDSRSNVKTGGSMFRNSQAYLAKTATASVPAVNFGTWLRQTVQLNDRVIVKMDIEGAEYCVLQSLLASGDIHYVDELIIEWHGRFMPNDGHTQSTILWQLQELGIKVTAWW